MRQYLTTHGLELIGEEAQERTRNMSVRPSSGNITPSSNSRPLTAKSNTLFGMGTTF